MKITTELFNTEVKIIFGRRKQFSTKSRSGDCSSRPAVPKQYLGPDGTRLHCGKTRTARHQSIRRREETAHIDCWSVLPHGKKLFHAETLSLRSERLTMRSRAGRQQQVRWLVGIRTSGRAAQFQDQSLRGKVSRRNH